MVIVEVRVVGGGGCLCRGGVVAVLVCMWSCWLGDETHGWAQLELQE